jgi:hypothetical protein
MFMWVNARCAHPLRPPWPSAAEAGLRLLGRLRQRQVVERGVAGSLRRSRARAAPVRRFRTRTPADVPVSSADRLDGRDREDLLDFAGVTPQLCAARLCSRRQRDLTSVQRICVRKSEVDPDRLAGRRRRCFGERQARH